MTDLKYVKKARHKKIVAITSGICSIGVAVFVTIAFIGDAFGTFNVALESGEVSLSLSSKKTFENETSFLRVNDVPVLNQYTNAGIIEHDKIDNENYGFDYAGKRNEDGSLASLYFFKYTFYVKSKSDINISYNVKIDIEQNTRPTNASFSLDEILRVRLYSGDADLNTHNYKVFAKSARTPRFAPDDIDKVNPDYREPISGAEGSSKFAGYAEEFLNNSTICDERYSNVTPNSIRRFTIVYWLEGEDPEAGGIPPQDATLRLGVKIEGHQDAS